MQTENAQNENKNLKKEEKKFEDKINSLLEEEKELQKVDETREEYEASIQRAQKQVTFPTYIHLREHTQLSCPSFP